MDPFHATQRVLKTVKLHHMLKAERTQFIRDLKMAYRRKHDTANERKFPTETSEGIKNNIDRLLDVWRSKLKEETVIELLKLKNDHSECLSNIGLSCGTHKNERLHRELRRLFRNHNNMSLELAVAILTTHFCIRNRRLQKDDRPLVPGSLPMVLENTTMTEVNLDGFGLATTDDDSFAPILDICPQIPHQELAEKIIKFIRIHDSMKVTTVRRTKIEILLTVFHKIPNDCPGTNEEEFKQIFHEHGLIPNGEPHNTVKELGEKILPTFIFSNGLSDEEYLKIISDRTGAIVILLSTSKTLPIQTITPEELVDEKALFVLHDNQFYNTCAGQEYKQDDQPKKKRKEEQCDDEMDKPASKKKKLVTTTCNCSRGRNIKNPCSTKQCQCWKKSNNCSIACKCFNCQNKKPEKKKTHPCRCGQNGGQDSCSSNRCDCYATRNSCSG